MNIKPKNKDLKTIEAEAKLDRQIEELKIKQATFQKEVEMRQEILHNRIEAVNHNLLVAEHDLGMNIGRGIKKIAVSTKSIVYPEDVM